MKMIVEEEIEKQQFRMGNATALELFVAPGRIFQPNQTSETVYTSVEVYDGDVGIEIGSGIGPGTILLARRQIGHLYTVEIIPEQCNIQMMNLELHGLCEKVSVLQGSLFEPIRDLYPDLKADFIVSDVSGMNDIGEELGWYPQNIPRGGVDGAENIIPFLVQAKHFLNIRNERARVYFPIVVNFSDGKKIIDKARENYSNLEKIAERRIPLKQEQLTIIENSKHAIFEPIERKGSRGLWKVEVYRAMQPIY